MLQHFFLFYSRKTIIRYISNGRSQILSLYIFNILFFCLLPCYWLLKRIETMVSSYGNRDIQLLMLDGFTNEVFKVKYKRINPILVKSPKTEM